MAVFNAVLVVQLLQKIIKGYLLKLITLVKNLVDKARIKIFKKMPLRTRKTKTIIKPFD